MSKNLSPDLTDLVIRMAWHDRTTFEEIREKTDLTEAAVIKLMRRQLKPSSFRRWRKRVTARLTKHRKLLKAHLQRFPEQETTEVTERETSSSPSPSSLSSCSKKTGSTLSTQKEALQRI